MILTCPECATSYFVDDSRVPAAGRAVKCSHCGAKWTAQPDAPPPAESAPETPPAAAPPRADVPPPDEIVVEGPQAAEAEAPIALPPRRRTEPRRAPREGGSVLGWVVAAAVVVGLVAGLLIFRSEITRIVPAARPVYASVGLPANPLGLVIEGVKVDPGFQGGRPVLAVSGQIRNVGGAMASAPSLRVSLLDKDGKAVSAKVAQPIDPKVPAGAVRHFAIAIVDPPANVHDLKVTFEEGAKRPAPGAPPPRAAEAVMAAPAPIEAQPLPAGSPDALPKHD